MRIGEEAELLCTPDFAYGAGGFPAWGIQPNTWPEVGHGLAAKVLDGDDCAFGGPVGHSCTRSTCPFVPTLSAGVTHSSNICTRRGMGPTACFARPRAARMGPAPVWEQADWVAPSASAATQQRQRRYRAAVQSLKLAAPSTGQAGPEFLASVSNGTTLHYQATTAAHAPCNGDGAQGRGAQTIRMALILPDDPRLCGPHLARKRQQQSGSKTGGTPGRVPCSSARSRAGGYGKPLADSAERARPATALDGPTSLRRAPRAAARRRDCSAKRLAHGVPTAQRESLACCCVRCYRSRAQAALAAGVVTRATLLGRRGHTLRPASNTGVKQSASTAIAMQTRRRRVTLLLAVSSGLTVLCSTTADGFKAQPHPFNWHCVLGSRNNPTAQQKVRLYCLHPPPWSSSKLILRHQWGCRHLATCREHLFVVGRSRLSPGAS
eukprot:scaffold1761_cov357-Prasinococcus_capsulatus_cf.AAC.13